MKCSLLLVSSLAFSSTFVLAAIAYRSAYVAAPSASQWCACMHAELSVEVPTEVSPSPLPLLPEDDADVAIAFYELDDPLDESADSPDGVLAGTVTGSLPRGVTPSSAAGAIIMLVPRCMTALATHLLRHWATARITAADVAYALTVQVACTLRWKQGVETGFEPALMHAASGPASAPSAAPSPAEEGCGGLSQECCDLDCDTGLACDFFNTMFGKECVTCGGAGQLCCFGEDLEFSCAGGLVCDFGSPSLGPTCMTGALPFLAFLRANVQCTAIKISVRMRAKHICSALVNCSTRQIGSIPSDPVADVL